MGELHNLVGFAGTAMIILAYLLLQLEKLTIQDITYSLLNLIGALAILVSLYFEPNLPSFVIELFWVMISFVEVYRFLIKKQSRQT